MREVVHDEGDETVMGGGGATVLAELNVVVVGLLSLFLVWLCRWMLSPASCLELRAVGGDASRVHVKAPNKAGGPRATCMCKTQHLDRETRY